MSHHCQLSIRAVAMKEDQPQALIDEDARQWIEFARAVNAQ